MSKTAIYVRISAEIKAIIDKVALDYGISEADFIRFIINRELERLGYIRRGVVSLEPQPSQKEKEVG
jgi:hypothetical protein